MAGFFGKGFFGGMGGGAPGSRNILKQWMKKIPRKSIINSFTKFWESILKQQTKK